MLDCAVSPLAAISEPFAINHKENSFTVDKIRFAIFSGEIQENFCTIGNSLNIDNSISDSAVEQIVSIVSNVTYEITKENVFDLIQLSIELKISSIQNDLIFFIEDNFALDELILKAKEIPRNSLFSGLKIAISQQLDSALLIPSFHDLEIEKIIDILTYEGRVYSDHHLLFSFIMEQVEIHKKQSLPLLEVIDIQRLTQKEAEQFFANENLFSSDSCVDYVISDLDRIEQRIVEVNARMKQAGSRTSGKVLNEKFNVIQQALEEVIKVIDKNEERSYVKVSDLKDRVTNIQRRVKNDSRRTRADFKAIQSKIKSLDSKIQKEFPVE